MLISLISFTKASYKVQTDVNEMEKSNPVKAKGKE